MLSITRHKWHIVVLLFIAFLATVNALESNTEQPSINTNSESKSGGEAGEVEPPKEGVFGGEKEKEKQGMIGGAGAGDRPPPPGDKPPSGERPPGHPQSRDCVPISKCTRCADDEKDQDYCFNTGFRIAIECEVSNSKEVHYQSCHGEAPTDVYVYEALAFGLFILSCYAVRLRRAKLVQKQAEKIAKQIGSSV